MEKIYEIRDPIHGFIQLNELEWDLINQPAFQRLRRIRQLAWTDMVYPSAMHTRFAHSLGVMHVAGRLFGELTQRSGELLESEFGMLHRHQPRFMQIVRLAALLHDVGHGPFSHAAEELLPTDGANEKRFTHEDYTAAIVQYELAPVINEHRLSRNDGIIVDDIIGIFRDTKSGPNLVLKGVVSGQMDADRMDYLLRDSYHAGVSYGHYDLDRVLATTRLCVDPDDGTVLIGISENGVHAVEGLLIARYMMFTQLYFHKTRAVYDHHLAKCLHDLLHESDGVFPLPDQAGIKKYLDWHDWKVLGAISSGAGGEHGRILLDRKHFRLIYQTPEVPSAEDLKRLEEVNSRLVMFGCVRLPAEKSWYKTGSSEVFVVPDEARHEEHPIPLSHCSTVVHGLKPISQQRLYVAPERREEAMAAISALGQES